MSVQPASQRDPYREGWDLACDLIAHGIPVVICAPNHDWEPGSTRPDVIPPAGWNTITAEQCDISRFRPGIDTLALVSGHGVDVVDEDPKPPCNGSIENLPTFRYFGVHQTPSGGRHFLVRSTGIPKIQGLATQAGPVGDYCGGTANGGGRMLAYLPGSSRPKYSDMTYWISERVDLDALAEFAPDEHLADILRANCGRLDGEAGRLAASRAETRQWLAEHSSVPDRQCHYGRKAVNGLIEHGRQIGARGGGRHGWALAAATRVVELCRAGCATSADIQSIADTLREIKPEEAFEPLLRWAVANAEGETECGLHGPKTKPATPTTVADQLAGIVSINNGWTGAGPGTPAAAPQAAPAEDEDDAARARRLFPRLDWQALWADETEEEWLHEPLLAARRSVVIYSPPKVGKSLLVLEFAVALSRGGMFLGHMIRRRIRTLYVDFENDPRGDVRSRLQAMGYGPDDLEELVYLSFPTMAGLDTERGSLELLEVVKAYAIEVIIIDTVSRAVDGEENSNDTWLGMYRHTGLKLKQAGIAMVRLDHTGKDETKGQRGGSAKSGDVDAVWRLTRVAESRFRLECTDSRMSIDTKVMRVSRQRVPRLRHVLENHGGITNHEAKVAHLIELADANGLPDDANRDAIRAFAKERGMPVGTDVIRDVIKARKDAAATPKTDRSAQVSTGAQTLEVHTGSR